MPTVNQKNGPNAALDIVGPYEVLARLPDAEVRFVGEDRGPIRTDNQVLGIVADRARSEITSADVLVVPGGFATRALERLRAGGRAVFLEPNPWNPQWYVHLAMHPRRSWRVERGIVRVWPGRVCRGFEAAGFRAC